jgi:catechol 2,3-dioxygenase-like lactoylglutathione lyase family enzyme
VSPQLDAFGIVVSDMARAIAFYRKLGLEFPEGAEGEGHVEAQTPGGLRYMLDREDVITSFDPDWTRPEGGVHGGAFRCESPEEVDRVFGELLEAGGRAHKEPWDAFWGQRYAQVADPDGTIVDLFAALPQQQS